MKILKDSNTMGFILLELMVVLGIMSALASIAIPNYMSYREKAKAASCTAHRHNIEHEVLEYFLEHRVHNPEIADKYKCPSGGVYMWIISDPDDPDYPKVGCSMHYWPTAEPPKPEPPKPIPPKPIPPKPLTSLGSTFEEITSGMIGLIEKFYVEHGKYPRSWGDYRFTDIGLDPAEWGRGYNGIIYSPCGNRVNVKPDEGYVFYVTDLKGKERKLSWEYKWNLVYSVKKGQWYYHSIKKKNAIDISTLKVEKYAKEKKIKR
ncbi:MAG: type II secretion system protein [Deltaproteobacteria bacterium]|nr:type II secretion system protein [Deltaproteobacteria bacterium]MBW1736325.1 type II secretion system protein [Deltaproteobacteria bacterium]MBW1909006.1 type II secretion system protein [Deltaproteobacteria bacterium]MBW2033100.1 type II secretion system protein [Deltaproteobacteria bacterium]MBW2113747.1 type II secretion system protein [Deltaproteobacteria bacterium]